MRSLGGWSTVLVSWGLYPALAYALPFLASRRA